MQLQSVGSEQLYSGGSSSIKYKIEPNSSCDEDHTLSMRFDKKKIDKRLAKPCLKEANVIATLEDSTQCPSISMDDGTTFGVNEKF